MLKSKKQLIAFILFVVAISFAFPAFAQYTPLVRIPGLPSSGSISLSMYLVGLYNFLVSIVGIIAVMMMIVGGLRYITAGGSSTAIGDAKDIISSAVYGLIIAIFAWVIVAAINPDVLYIKKPGLSTVSSISAYSCVGSFVASTTCVCPDGTTLPAFATETECNNACKAGSNCSGLKNNCVRDGVNITTSPKFNSFPNNGKCLCADGADVVPVPLATCQATCATANCLKADIKLGISKIYNPDSGWPPTVDEQTVRISAVFTDAEKLENALYISESLPCVLVIENQRFSTVSNLPVNYDLDMLTPITGMDFETSGTYKYILASCKNNYAGYWAAIGGSPGACKQNTVPGTPHYEAWVCPLGLRITDSLGNVSYDKAYLGMEKP